MFLTLVSYARGASVNLTWDAPDNEDEVTGYKIYWSTTSGSYSDLDSIDIVGETRATISGIDDSKKYYFIVRAYNDAGIGPASNEVSWSDTTAPMAPIVTGTTPTNDATPSWSWISGGGGNETFRYRLDNSDLSTGTTETTDTSYTPYEDLSEGSHTLYVQERDNAGNWSNSAYKTILIDYSLDSDNDGMPDLWETQYFSYLSQDGDEDYDGDGYTNLAEYLKGTDPTDPESHPTIKSMSWLYLLLED